MRMDSKNIIKFRLLTIGEMEELEAEAADRKDDFINSESTMILEAQIASINGNMDRAYISNYVENMRVLDAKKLRDYMSTVYCGIDMNISIQTPKGDIVNTFLPLTTKFFWPDFEI